MLYFTSPQHDLEVQEGDPKYLAPEILINNSNITCAADIFSLGMTILELATDLDLPRGGDPWHQLRNRQIPSEIVASLSKDLMHIIMLMIEPDHLRRATADQLLDMPTIRRMMGKRKLNYFVTKQRMRVREIVCRFKMCVLTFWYFVLKPFKLVGNILGASWRMLKRFLYRCRGEEEEKEEATDLVDNEKNKMTHHTSTPKKTLNIINNVPIITTMHADDDENQSNGNQ